MTYIIKRGIMNTVKKYLKEIIVMNSVAVFKGNVEFNLKLKGIRDDIMRVESTEKPRAMGVPEYLKLIFDGSTFKTYKANGWKVRIMK